MRNLPQIVTPATKATAPVGHDKVLGEFVWHKHAETDDFFLVLKGTLTIQMRDGDVQLGPGELFVVPRGIEHCPRCDEEVHLLLIEPSGTCGCRKLDQPL